MKAVHLLSSQLTPQFQSLDSFWGKVLVHFAAVRRH